MTTVVWDGKELVSDSRLTAIDRNKRITGISDNYSQKIITGNNLVFNGMPVRAIAISGDMNALNVFQTLPPNTDLIDVALYGEGALSRAAAVTSGYLYVLDNHVIHAEINREVGRFDIVTWPKDTSIAIGSGIAIIGKLMKYRYSARQYVSIASLFDMFTGGTLDVWNGNTIKRGVKPVGKCALIALWFAQKIIGLLKK